MEIIYNKSIKDIIPIESRREYELYIEALVDTGCDFFIMGSIKDIMVITAHKAFKNKDNVLCITLDKDSKIRDSDYYRIGVLAYVEGTYGEQFAMKAMAVKLSNEKIDATLVEWK